MVVVAVILSMFSIYFYSQYQKTQQLLKNPSQQTKIETDALVVRVGFLIELPKDEQPTLATVSDKSKLKGQLFFALAKNGDKVLIYTKAKKAILYRPSINKIINVAPVNIGTTQQNQATVEKITPTP